MAARANGRRLFRRSGIVFGVAIAAGILSVGSASEASFAYGWAGLVAVMLSLAALTSFALPVYFRVVNAWDPIAAYEAELKVYWRIRSVLAPGLRYSQYVWEEVLESLVAPSDVWLDLGCGHNLLPEWRQKQETALVARCPRVLGLDYDFESLAKHRVITDRVRGDASHLPFRDASVDLVISNMVFEHLSDPRGQLAEVYRILRPGGRLAFHTPNSLGYTTMASRLVPGGLKHGLIWVFQRRTEDDVFTAFYRMNSRSAIRRIAEEVGFQVEGIRMIVTDASLARIAPLAVVELVWIRLLMTSQFEALRTNIVAILEKPGRGERPSTDTPRRSA